MNGDFSELIEYLDEKFTGIQGDLIDLKEQMRQLAEKLGVNLEY